MRPGLWLVALLAVTMAHAADPRVDGLRLIDARFTDDGTDESFPTPNLKLKQDWHERNYWDKAAALLGLVDAGVLPETGVADANKFMRYVMLGKWRLEHTGQVEGDSGLWMHRSRTLSLRLYMAYRDRFDDDIRAEFERRIEWLVRPPYVRLSENIKLTNNSSYYLAHELRGAKDRESFSALRDWLVNYLRRHGTNGSEEWGSSYNAWTLLAILNLAEFAQDAEVKQLATMAVDYDIARMLCMSIDREFCSGAVRRYPFFTLHGYIEPQTQWLYLLFKGQPASDELWADFALSNYAPPEVFRAIGTEPSYEAAFSDAAGARNVWRHYFYRDGNLGMASMRAPGANEFVQPSGGTHDIVGCFIQSGANPRHHVVPFGYLPQGGPKKMRNQTERYFGYKNVAIVQHGGGVKAVWARGVRPDVRIRLFYHAGFRCTIKDGWAFLSDGSIYVAWAPALGAPEHDPESAEFCDPQRQGRWLRSTHVPGPQGEAAILEGADASSYASFESFQQDLLSRNPRPRLGSDGLRYVARDGAIVEFTPTEVRLDGHVFNPAGHPRADAPWVHGSVVTADGAELGFDFEKGRMTGAQAREPRAFRFGVSKEAAPRSSSRVEPAEDGQG